MISVTITRFGGVTGIPRSWLLELEPEEVDRLNARGGAAAEVRSRDRFTYRVRTDTRVFEIPESAWDDSCRSLLARAQPNRRDGAPGDRGSPA